MCSGRQSLEIGLRFAFLTCACRSPVPGPPPLPSRHPPPDSDLSTTFPSRPPQSCCWWRTGKMPLKLFKQRLKSSLESPARLCRLVCAAKLSAAAGNDVSRSVPALQINPLVYEQGKRTILSGFIKAQLLFNPVLQNPKAVVGFVGRGCTKFSLGPAGPETLEKTIENLVFCWKHL